MLLRMVPFVEHNYNMVELAHGALGNRICINRSHPIRISSQVARLRWRVCSSTIATDNVDWSANTTSSALTRFRDHFDQKDGVNIMKGYMESGEFSRGRESIRADGSIVMLGNFEVDVEHQQRIGHLLGPLPPEMRNDTAFMDRIHAYLPGWMCPKLTNRS